MKPLEKDIINRILVFLKEEHKHRYALRSLNKYKLIHLTEDLGRILREIPLRAPVIDKIITDLMFEQKSRYGEKMRKDYKGYERNRNSYSLEHLYDDLEFVLRHIGFK